MLFKGIDAAVIIENHIGIEDKDLVAVGFKHGFHRRLPPDIRKRPSEYS
jgi:hypothetical protein